MTAGASLIRWGLSSLADSSRLLALQNRRACSLPTTALSDAVEAHVQTSLRAQGVSVEGLTVRVVSCRDFKYPAVEGMKARYGGDYPDDFSYQSKALLACQVDGGHSFLAPRVELLSAAS